MWQWIIAREAYFQLIGTEHADGKEAFPVQLPNRSVFEACLCLETVEPWLDVVRSRCFDKNFLADQRQIKNARGSLRVSHSDTNGKSERNGTTDKLKNGERVPQANQLSVVWLLQHSASRAFDSIIGDLARRARIARGTTLL